MLTIRICMSAHTLSNRHHLSEGDIDFLCAALGAASEGAREAVMRLLADPAETDALLELPAVTRALANLAGPLRLSLRLYLYLHIRAAFKRTGIEDREVADYASCALAGQASSEQHLEHFRERGSPLLASVDYLRELEAAVGSRRFHLSATAADHYLFMTGLHPDYIAARERRRGAPGLAYYEEVGRTCYASARDHRLAREYGLEDTFDALAQNFHQARLELNACARDWRLAS